MTKDRPSEEFKVHTSMLARTGKERRTVVLVKLAASHYLNVVPKLRWDFAVCVTTVEVEVLVGNVVTTAIVAAHDEAHHIVIAGTIRLVAEITQPCLRSSYIGRR